MNGMTFGRKLGLGFACVVALTALLGVVALLALRRVPESKDRVLDEHAALVADSEALSAAVSVRQGALLRYAITDDADELRRLRERQTAVEEVRARITGRLAGTQESAFASEIERLEREVNVA